MNILRIKKPKALINNPVQTGANSWNLVSPSVDPDGEELSYKWVLYDNFGNVVSSSIPDQASVSVTTPSGSSGDPPPETAEAIARWDQNNSNSNTGGLSFEKTINCGAYPNKNDGRAVNTPTFAESKSGNSSVTIGTTQFVRFPGTRSVRQYTNANIEASCNQNFTAERAELTLGGNEWNRAGRSRVGNTLWMGWSEYWEEIDDSHTTTVVQWRNGVSSPSMQMNMQPGKVLRIQNIATGTRVTSVVKTIKEKTWYDIICEIKYSKGSDGYMKVWLYEASSSLNYSYSDNTSAQILNRRTLRDTDNNPHLRWGVYRHSSGDKKPPQIKVEDRYVIRHIGPARFHWGNNLGAVGFNAVKPRNPSSSGGGGNGPFTAELTVSNSKGCSSKTSILLV